MNRNDIEQLVRPNIRELKPYRSARDDFGSGTLLDANENAWGAPVPNRLNLHRYPVPVHAQLRQKVASFRGVEPDSVFFGNGSDEPIDLLVRIFCKPGVDAIVTTPPTYGMYKVSARINDVNVIEIPLTEEFELRTEEILAQASEATKILFLCSPNNPTANDLDRASILKLVELFPGIVVVDEAYIDFSRQESMAPMVQQYPNLVVLQTFSKSFGMAGARLGIAFAGPEILSWMMKVKPPYNINKLTSDIALQAFEKLDLIRINLDMIRKEQVRLSKELAANPAVVKVFRSDANFLLFRIPKAHEAYQKLAEKGIIVRYRGNEPLCENCLRVTVGLPDENDRFLRLLENITSSGTETDQP
ncbi:MAG: histidinol-phosphate transaminase [Balneolaceae bacterium]